MIKRKREISINSQALGVIVDYNTAKEDAFRDFQRGVLSFNVFAYRTFYFYFLGAHLHLRRRYYL